MIEQREQVITRFGTLFAEPLESNLSLGTSSAPEIVWAIMCNFGDGHPEPIGFGLSRQTAWLNAADSLRKMGASEELIGVILRNNVTSPANSNRI